jgi:L,D-peptidoglycan transpeptidase YkuD (ErfK/YbiS/YcfS/YnhG family)
VITVHARPGDVRRGILKAGWLTFPCALGKNGIGAIKREGDGRTPRANLTVISGFHRAGRWPFSARASWMLPLPDGFGWCDAPESPNYNRAVRLPHAASHETLWREDGLYDCVLVLDWNTGPRARNRGSAIFLHLARPGHLPTEGCIALSRPDMARFLRLIRPGSRIATVPLQR